MTEFNPSTNDEQAAPTNQGSVANGIAGNYSFSIGTIISEAWEKTNGNKGTIWMGFLFYILAFIPFSIINTIVEKESVGMSMLIQLIQTIVLLPLGMGLYMIGIKIAANKPTSGKEIFAYFSSTVNLVLTYLLMIVLLAIGFLLLVLPGIYLMIAYQMALPLVVEKNMGPWEALETSRKTITHNWFQYFGLLIVLMIITVISIIPFGIGLIWSLPLLMLVYSMLYIKMFGFGKSQDENKSVAT